MAKIDDILSELRKLNESLSRIASRLDDFSAQIVPLDAEPPLDCHPAPERDELLSPMGSPMARYRCSVCENTYEVPPPWSEG